MAQARDSCDDVSVCDRGAKFNCRCANSMDVGNAVLGAAVFCLAAPKTVSHTDRLSDVRVLPAYGTVCFSVLRTLSLNRKDAGCVAVYDRLSVRREHFVKEDFTGADYCSDRRDDGECRVHVWPIRDWPWRKSLRR